MNLRTDSDANNDNNEEINFVRASPIEDNRRNNFMYRTYPASFGNVRLITPYVIQHLLAARFQNPEYPGKSNLILQKKKENFLYEKPTLKPDSDLIKPKSLKVDI